MTSDEALALLPDDSGGAREQTKHFLEQIMEAQVIDSEKVMKQAKANGIHSRTLYKAKSYLGIKSIRDGSRWVWSAL